MTSPPPKFRPFDVNSLIQPDAADAVKRGPPSPSSSPATTAATAVVSLGPPTGQPLYPYLGLYQHLMAGGGQPLSVHQSTGLGLNPGLLNSLAMAAHNPLLAYSNFNSLHSPLSMVERMKQNRYSPYTCTPSPLHHSTPPILPNPSLAHSLLPPSSSPSVRSAFQSVLPKPSRLSPPPASATPPPSTSPGSSAPSPACTPTGSSGSSAHSDIRSIERMVKSLNGEGAGGAGGYAISHDGRRSLNIH